MASATEFFASYCDAIANFVVRPFFAAERLQLFDALVQPEPQRIEHGRLHLGVAVVEVRLATKEAVKVETLVLLAPRPVAALDACENDPSL